MSITEPQRDAWADFPTTAWRRAKEESDLRLALQDILYSPKRPMGRWRLGHIVTVQPDYDFAKTGVTVGSYAVEVIERVDKDTEHSMWRVVWEGITDSWYWHSVDQALIHLIAVRHGDRDDRGEIVTFASRVIGFNDSPAD